jgi:hypothetical protein
VCYRGLSTAGKKRGQSVKVSYKYDWKYKRATLNWLSPTVGLIRVHDDTEHIPGPYNYVMTVLVNDGEYELLGALGEFPTSDEVREFYAYMKSLGLKKGYKRAKAGKALYSVGESCSI